MPKVRSRASKRFARVLWSIFGAAIVGYFLYHTIEGDRGWFAMLRMQREVGRAETTLSTLQKEREEIEHKTQLLHNESMDPDLLDEKARELLNYGKPNEIIILTGTGASASEK